VTGQWFSLGTPVSSTNKIDCRDIAEMLEVALSAINLSHQLMLFKADDRAHQAQQQFRLSIGEITELAFNPHNMTTQSQFQRSRTKM
jgi:hypothetical protein